jgi:hypothetical protein
MDLSQAKIGKLCSDLNVFVIDEVLGESEFEVEEVEVTVTVTDMNGEWGIFIPTAAVTAAPNNTAVTNGTAGETAGEKAGEKAGEVELTGVFGAGIEVAGGLKSDIIFPASVRYTVIDSKYGCSQIIGRGIP